MAQLDPKSVSLKPKELEKDAERMTALLQIKDYKPHRDEYGLKLQKK